MADAAEDFNKEAFNVMTLFMDAAAKSDVAKMKKMIAAGLDVNSLDSIGHSVLHIACELGNLGAVEALLDAGADKNILSSLCMTPLGLALAGGYTPIVKLLLAKGADPDQLVDTDTSPLTIAVSGGSEEHTRLLLQHEASITPRPPSKDAQATVITAGAGHLSILRILHEEFGADLNISSGPEGLTPLCAAIKNHKEGCFDYLLKKGADIHVLGAEGMISALELAVTSDNPWATQELLRRGMAVDGVGDKRRFPSLIAAAMVGAAKSAAVLLAHGADIDAVSAAGNNARNIAQELGHSDVVTLIDEEQRRRHLKAVEQDSAHAHGGLAASTKVMRPLSFRKSQQL
ncbi:MAG: ankyrin repeat domain-containing protein [Alphaproteobacteria bacterium]